MVQTLVLNLGHVDQAIALTKEVHERAEINQLHNCTLVDFAFFWLGYDGIDHVVCDLNGGGVVRCQLDDAFVVDVDFCAGHFNDFTDHFTTRTDNFTDLVSWDLHGFDLWCVHAQIVGTSQCFAHFFKDVQTASFGLVKRLGHNLLGNTRDLNVHLQGCDSGSSTSNLKVHVAKVIFVTQDVGQNGVFAVVFHHETHRHTSNC